MMVSTSGISIHAPRVGGDAFIFQPGREFDISIHAPRVGGDDLMRAYYGVRYVFQSTPPVWGATGWL